MVHKFPKWQVSQPFHLPNAEGLCEADVKNLFQVSIVLIVQVHSKEVMGKVSDIGLPLTKGELLDNIRHMLFNRAQIGRRQEEEGAHSPLSPLVASSFC